MTLFFHALPCPLPGHAQNNYEKYDHKEITEFAIKIQLDEELCAELGAVPLSHDEILECQSLEEACWIPDEKWISDMCAAFKKASEMVLLTERTKSMAVAEAFMRTVLPGRTADSSSAVARSRVACCRARRCSSRVTGVDANNNQQE